MSYPRLVLQPPQYGGFEDTQKELDWYGNNPECIDRDRTPELKYTQTRYYPSFRKKKTVTAIANGADPLILTRPDHRRPLQRNSSPSLPPSLPPHTPETRQAVFLLSTPIQWTADDFDAYWPLVDNFWVCNKLNNAIIDKGTQSSYWWCRLYKGETVSETHGRRRDEFARTARRITTTRDK